MHTTAGRWPDLSSRCITDATLAPLLLQFAGLLGGRLLEGRLAERNFLIDLREHPINPNVVRGFGQGGVGGLQCAVRSLWLTGLVCQRA